MTSMPVSRPGRVLATGLAVAILAALAACKPTEPTAATPPPAAEAPAAAPAGPAPVVAGVLASAPLEVDRNEITTCNIEAIDGTHFAGAPLPVPAGGKFLVGGFLFDATTESVPDNLVLRVVAPGQTEAWETPIEGRMDRPGLPEFLKVGAWALPSGFMQDVQVGDLPPGRYHIEVSYERDGKRYVCDNGRDIEVGGAAPAAADATTAPAA
jgi:hypothetical protein